MEAAPPFRAFYILNDWRKKFIFNEELNQALYDKMSAEQEAYRGWLVHQPAAEILKYAYQYAVREDILETMSENDLPDVQAAALLEMKEPLKAVFEEFRSKSTNYMDVVLESLESCSAKAARMSQETRPSIREQLKDGASEQTASKGPSSFRGEER